MTRTKKVIYFLCTGNSCRSQMAEGFTRHIYGDDFDVYSGGLFARGVHPLAIQVMNESGINISEQTSDSINSALLDRASLVITLCRKAEENCPTLPKHVLVFHWGVEDPADFKGNRGEIEEKFRAVRDLIEMKVRGLDRIINRLRNE